MSAANRPPPLSPEARQQEALRRFQIGGIGLVLVLLLVALATLLTGNARQEAEVAKAQAQAAGVANPGVTLNADGSEPLAELGVEPSAAGNATAAPVQVPGSVVLQRPVAPATAPPSQTSGGVPDLQPDPDLRAPTAAPR
jgi:hypothetical protein